MVHYSVSASGSDRIFDVVIGISIRQDINGTVQRDVVHRKSCACGINLTEPIQKGLARSPPQLLTIYCQDAGYLRPNALSFHISIKDSLLRAGCRSTKPTAGRFVRGRSSPDALELLAEARGQLWKVQQHRPRTEQNTV